MLFTDTYVTLAHPVTAEYKDRGSRFLAYAYPVTSEQEVKKCLDGLKARYPDATHHCYAYVLHPDKSAQRANDDGEPANSAGKPILRQITARDLTGLLVVVVRYFGGTLLGVPGLIQAYGAAAKMALDTSEIITKQLMSHYAVTYDYAQEGTVYRVLRQLEATITGQEKTSAGKVFFSVPRSKEVLVDQIKQDYFNLQFDYLT